MVAKFKSANNSLLIAPRVFGCQINLPEVMDQESSEVVRFDLGPFLQGQIRVAKVKVLITRLLLLIQFWNAKPTYRKSWAGNLKMLSDLAFGPSF